MSVKAMTWAWEQNVPPSTKVVLMALADHADDDGACFPGLKTVGHKCRMQKRTVQHHLAVLRNQGLVTVKGRKRNVAPPSAESDTIPGGTLKKCVNSQAVYPLSEQDGLEAQERRYTAHEEGKH